MEKLFRSFEEIIQENIKVLDRPIGAYWAHIDGVNSRLETLYQHTDLVANYCLRLIKANDLEALIENIITSFAAEVSVTDLKKVAPILKEVFITSILFHDLGK